MSLFLSRLLITSGVAGSVGLTGYGAYTVSQVEPEKTMMDVLKELQITPLSFANDVNDQEWNEKIEEFSQGVNELDGFQIEKEDKNKEQINRGRMKQACLNLSLEKMNEINSYKFEQFKKWCTFS